MPERREGTSNEQLRELERIAERLEPRKPSIWDLLVLGAVAMLFFAIGLFIRRCEPFQVAFQPTSTPPSQNAEKPVFVLLGRYKDSIYYFSEPNGQVMRYDPVSDKSESVFDLTSYGAHLWSPQGDKIVIISNQDNDFGNLYVVDLSNPIQDVQPLIRRSASSIPKSFELAASSPLAWSPDESTIAVIAHDDESSDIFAVKTDGSETWRVTPNQRNISSIAWADNSTLAFVMQVNGQYKKYLIQLDGSRLREWR